MRSGYHCRFTGTLVAVEFERYGDLTDEVEQMRSAEAAVQDGAVIVCGDYAAALYVEMLRYLVTPN